MFLCYRKGITIAFLACVSSIAIAANYYIQIAVYGGQYSHYNFPTDNDMMWIGANVATVGYNAALPVASKLKPGDTVTVQYVDGVKATFDVTNPTSTSFPLGQSGPNSVEGGGGGGSGGDGGGGYGGGAIRVTVIYQPVTICMGNVCVSRLELIEILVHSN